MTDRPTPARLVPEHVALLDQVEQVIRDSDRDAWWEGPTYRSPCGMKHCALAHVETALGMEVMERFESVWSTSYVIGWAVNDQRSERYPQEHPKDRVLAFLANLRSGVEDDVWTSFDRCARAEAIDGE